MFKGRELIGLSVIDLKTGKEGGAIEDLILDLDHGKVTALSIKSSGWLTTNRLVPLANVQRVGSDTVLIEDEIKETIEADGCGIKSLKGCSVLSYEGKDLGTVEDLILDIPEGRITGWEISDGLVQDLIEGRRVLPLDSVITCSSDRFIVREGGW
jgi:uncharacterized protein YrrD